jgi:hypothetical protein
LPSTDIAQNEKSHHGKEDVVEIVVLVLPIPSRIEAVPFMLNGKDTIARKPAC